ncbi:hypothetical protein EYF80_034323 [Liparis tanakae]|uniref:Uncharacterized protein n=1 Tax=Liparis tanakae TaxID=230148 RepID=A0A4Z2GQ74_9TELE|nr:hypothetical protein EYF80_034323 [Liparis tanakae]
MTSLGTMLRRLPLYMAMSTRRDTGDGSAAVGWAERQEERSALFAEFTETPSGRRSDEPLRASYRIRRGSKFKYIMAPLWSLHTDCEGLQRRNSPEIKASEELCWQLSMVLKPTTISPNGKYKELAVVLKGWC